MNRKTTSLKIEEEIWKKAKIYCIKNNILISEYIEKLLKDGLKKKVIRI